jgi:hypothetical protein
LLIDAKPLLDVPDPELEPRPEPPLLPPDLEFEPELDPRPELPLFPPDLELDPPLPELLDPEPDPDPEDLLPPP